MKLRMHTLWVLFKKDLKMMMYNKNIIIMLMLPIAFLAIYQSLFSDAIHDGGGDGAYIIGMCSILNICAVSLNGVAMMVAEEKEKNTLRVLMLHDVNAIEYIVSKLIVMLIASDAVGVVMYLISSYPLETFLPYLFIVTLTAIPILLFGSIIGLYSKDQMSTGTISAPLMLLFMIPPMVSGISSVFETVAGFIPTTAMFDLIAVLFSQQSIFSPSCLMEYVLLLAWFVLGMALFAVIYKKKMKDN